MTPNDRGLEPTTRTCSAAEASSMSWWQVAGIALTVALLAPVLCVALAFIAIFVVPVAVLGLPFAFVLWAGNLETKRAHHVEAVVLSRRLAPPTAMPALGGLALATQGR